MGVTKIERYKPQQLELSSMLKALGHPARVAIVEYLLKADDCICGDIVNELPLAQPTVSQHFCTFLHFSVHFCTFLEHVDPHVDPHLALIWH